jgi:hypothetical protein
MSKQNLATIGKDWLSQVQQQVKKQHIVDNIFAKILLTL